jgi:hypothetical protein
MARLPLMHKGGAERGQLGAGVEYLRELARRLRHNPTPEECEAAAVLFERAAVAGPGGAAVALYLVPAHRPRENDTRDFEIWQAVGDTINEGARPAAAYKLIAKQYKISASRVKAIALSFSKADREVQAEWQDR